MASNPLRDLCEGKVRPDYKSVFATDASDGDHSFNELYAHRAVLFSVILHMFKELSWKSRLHDDGTMYPGYFIVGINTPAGMVTYHYKDEWWDLFDVLERKKAPLFDGATPDDSLTRLLSLRNDGSSIWMEAFMDFYLRSHA